MEKVTKVVVMLAMVALVCGSNVEGGRLLKEEENVKQPQNFLGSGGLGGIFPSPSPGSASPVWALGQTDFALSLVAVPLLCPLFPEVVADHYLCHHMHRKM